MKARVLLARRRLLVALGATLITAATNVAGQGDPVEAGLVRSLSSPGGNVTGLTNVLPDLGAKHLEMLLALIPKLDVAAVLVHPSNRLHTPTMFR